jgi:ion channel-forming bestrophin family protein
MIVRPKLNWFRMLFVWHGSVLRTILPQLLLVLGIASFVVWCRGRLFHHVIPLNVAPFTLIGVSLAVFLGFRNNASYDRYWEGRKLWGSLLNINRSLVRQALTTGGVEDGDPRIKDWVSLVLAFTHTLRHQLRRSDPAKDLVTLLGPERSREVLEGRYRPALVLVLLGKWVSDRRKEGLYGEITAVSFEQNLNHLSDVLGGCERLASTPLPYPYSVMIHRTVYIYCFLLPFGLISTIGVMTPVISVVVAYTFMVLEALSEELEEPFGTRPNDLPLENMCQMIQDTVTEMSGEKLEQASTVPRDFVLL